MYIFSRKMSFDHKYVGLALYIWCIYAEVVDGGLKKGYIWNVPTVCAPDRATLGIATRCSPCSADNTWVWKRPVGIISLIACGVTPTFHHQSVISHHQLTRFVIFIWKVYILIKSITATIIGRNRAIVGQVPHFGPFPLKNQQKEYQKVWKTKFHQIRFSACQTIHHKSSTPVVFWGGKRPWVECGGSIRKHSVPTFELDFCPDHLGGPFGLKLHETSSCVI